MSEKRKLLLADDSVTVQKVVNLAFESEDIEIIAAHDGDTALEKLDDFSPDLVMADVNMPGADGYEICERIKGDEATKHIPVILLVGSFEPFSEEKARRVGADDFLKKPFQSINLLIEKVHQLLANQNAAETLQKDDFSEADTQPMPVYQMPASSTEEDDRQAPESYDAGELGESEMDDEMIETRQVGDYPIMDETSRYQTRDASPDFEEPETSNAEDYAASNSYGYETVEKFPQAETAANEQPVYEIADEAEETSYEDYSAYSRKTEEEKQAAPTTAAELDFSDAELLEIPPLDTDQEISETRDPYEDRTEATESEAAPTAEGETAEQNQEFSSYEEYSAEETFEEQMESAETFQEESSGAETSGDDDVRQETYETESKEPKKVDFAPIDEEETQEASENYSEQETAQHSAEDDSSEEASSEEEQEREETQMAIADETREIIKSADNELIIHYFPPEVIDAIAERVVEKLAEKLRK